MLLMQRLGSFEHVRNDKYIDDYIDIIKSNPGSCDNVWLATPYGYPTLETHREYAEFLVKSAKKFRDSGISVSMQISNSVGHGHQCCAYDCSGLIFDGSEAERLVGADGTVAEYCFCWRGEHFKKYMLEALSYYLRIKPERLWFDDDFSMQHHTPVEFGCFCDGCMEKFNREKSTSFTREELYNEILFGDIKWREEWMNFTRRGLGEFVSDVCDLLRKISPETAMGHQHGSYGAYYAYDFNHIFDEMKNGTGKAPYSRPGGGAYNDHNPNLIIGKALDISVQNSRLPDYVKHNAPEIENIPFNRFGKSPAGTAFETSLYFAFGATDMSYSMLMDNPEEKEWYKKAFRLLSEQREYWEHLSRVNINSYQGGIRYYTSDNARFMKLRTDENIDDLKQNFYREMMPLIRDSVPVAFDRQENSVILLYPDNVRGLQDSDIEYLLGKNVITDGETVKMLQDRGFDIGLDIYEVCSDDAITLREKFYEHPTKPRFRDWYQSSFFTAGRKTVCYAECRNKDAEILSIYESDIIKKPYTSDTENPFGIAEVIVKTNKGKNWAVMCYCPWKGIIPDYIKNHLLDVTDYISDNALPARITDSSQLLLLPRKNADGKTVCVSVVNCTVGKTDEQELMIRNPVGMNFTFESQYNGKTELSFEKRGEDYIVILPPIDAWSVSTVFIEA